jgi:diaminohydroxyphosphoribosylaminopyrimidine deaminase/5-amino-6-(5-phosphoribosylamino)uracil reductase
MSFSSLDHAMMARALQLAENARGVSTPNPNVGCVITRDGEIIGEGWTQKAGGNHAEIQALHDARERGHGTTGATAYVTLEPCSHFGRTPPCADALIASGITRVVAALTDPNPLVAGQGLARLANAGIAVESGLMESAARSSLAGFLSRMERGRPWVRVKIAASADGRTALANGQSQWITGAAARRDVHRLRAHSCGVLTGIGTVLADDPQLTARDIGSVPQPRRIVADTDLRTPTDARVLAGGSAWIACSAEALQRPAATALQSEGAVLLATPLAEGKLDLAALFDELGRRGINELMVEAGAALSGAVIAAGLADEIVLYLAPCLMGDASRALANLPGFAAMAEIPRFTFHEVRRIGEDLRLILRPQG